MSYKDHKGKSIPSRNDLGLCPPPGTGDPGGFAMCGLRRRKAGRNHRWSKTVLPEAERPWADGLCSPGPTTAAASSTNSLTRIVLLILIGVRILEFYGLGTYTLCPVSKKKKKDIFKRHFSKVFFWEVTFCYIIFCYINFWHQSMQLCVRYSVCFLDLAVLWRWAQALWLKLPS